ncbi:response regulator [Oxalobacteraceae bacterium A2-2]
MQNHPIAVLVVDDHPLFRQGLASILEDEAGIALVGQAATGRAALDECARLRPDIVIMDTEMPELIGIDATALIKRTHPSTNVIVLTTFTGDVHAVRAIKAGAAGYLLKASVEAELAQAIRTVHAGGRHIASPAAIAMATHLYVEALSEREVQVLEQAAQGKTNRLIGLRLGISESTVKVHMKSILAKLDANDRTHAVILGLQRGIIDLCAQR